MQKGQIHYLCYLFQGPDTLYNSSCSKSQEILRKEGKSMKKTASLFLAVLLLLALLAPAALAADEITVYVSVADNGAPAIGEKSGQPMIAVPVTVPKDSTVDDVLRALHAAECAGGTVGYNCTKMDWMGSTTYMLDTWFGRKLDYSDGSKSVTAWKNHDMNSTLGSTVKAGDIVDVCVYTMVSSQNFTFSYYGQAWMDYYAVDAGVGEEFTVGVWRSAMDMQTFMYNTEPHTLGVTVNGMNSAFKVAPDGSLTMSFNEPGDYYVCVGGDAAYGAALMKVTVAQGATFTGHEPTPPGRMAASGLEDNAGGAPITVYATVTDCGGIFTSDKTGENLVAVPVTVPEGATLDDVLNAVNTDYSTKGEAGYASSGMEMYGSMMYFVTSWFGINTDGASGAAKYISAWVGTDMTSTLATPVKDGDMVYVSLYAMGSGGEYGFSYEYYGLGYFDYPTAEAGVGDEVILHAYTEAMAGMMGGEYRTNPLGGLTVYANGEDTGKTTDSNGEVRLTFDAPGVYDILAVGDSTQPAAAMRLTVKEGASFDPTAGSVDVSDVLAGKLSAPGHGTGPDITVYVTVTDKGDYAKSDLTGEYLIAYPVTVPEGSTMDDALQAFHGLASASGAMGYSSNKMDMWGTVMYSIGDWFGQPSLAMDGSDYAVIAWRNRDTMSSLADKLSDGDFIDVNIYGVKSSMTMEYRYWGLAYFDYGTVKAAPGEEITLTAYHATMDATTFNWNTFVSAGLTVYVNGEKSSQSVGNDGTVKLKFDQPGTYYVLAAPGEDTYGAAAVRVEVEAGASFKDSAPDTVVSGAKATPTKADYGPIIRILIIVVVVLIVIFAIVKVVKKNKKKEDNGQ